MLVAGGLVIAYGAFRSWRKANGPAKLYAEIVSMFTGGMGWGEIAHQLKLSIGPGIGSIMGGGQGNGQGQGEGGQPGGGRRR